MIRKLPVFLLFLLFLCVPFYVSADEIVNMKLDYSAPSGSVQFPNSSSYNSYVLDYDALIGDDSYEVFCVEYSQAGPTEGALTTYTLSTISGDLIQAALYAEFYYLYYEGKNNESYYKAAAQIIIWETLFETRDSSFSLISGNVKSTFNGGYIEQFLKAYKDYTAKNEITSSNWVVATNSSYQNYLIRYSVPEPTQMLLFGTGLILLAGIGRKRFLRK